MGTCSCMTNTPEQTHNFNEDSEEAKILKHGPFHTKAIQIESVPNFPNEITTNLLNQLPTFEYPKPLEEAPYLSPF